MKVSKKIISLIMVVLLVGTTFILPLSVSAVDNNISLTWEMNWINSTKGTDADLSKTIRTVGYTDINDYSSITINVLKNTSDGVYAYWYTKDKTFINRTDPNRKANNPNVITVPSNAKYVRFILWSEAITDNSILSKVNTNSGVDNEYFNITANKLPAINTSKTGSLKIYKYEMSDTASANTNGTGYDSDIEHVPTGAKPLNGVVFEVKQIANLNSTYYTKDGIELPTASTAASMSVIDTHTDTTSVVGNESGVVVFDNLPLGIYLVHEKSAPNHVTAPVDDFVVSIPSTSADGTSWKYDLSVFPKNKTSYANFQIEKVDKADANTKLSGAIFSLAKSEDNSTFTWIEDLTTNTNGIATPTKSLPVNCYYRLRENTAPTGYIKDVANNNNDTYFYLDESGRILSRDKSTVISAPANATTPAVLDVNNSKPTIKKFIDKSRGNGTDLISRDSIRRYDDNNNYQYYMVQVATPNISSAMSTLKTFKVTDSFIIIDGSICAPQIYKITYGDAAATANANVLSTDAYTFTVNQNSTTNTTYDTTLTFDTSKIQNNTNYYIYYKTYVKWGTNNKAKLTYSTVTSGTDETQTIESNTVYYINGSYKFKKTDQNGTALQGAKFQLFASEADALARKNPVYLSTDGKGGGLTYTLTSNSSGTVVFYNVDIGTGDSIGPKDYWLVETKAPNGYNILAAPERITVGGGYANSFQMEVVNTPKYVFPLTGGQGILIIVVIGVIFVGGAVSLLIVKKKKNKKGEVEYEIK